MVLNIQRVPVPKPVPYFGKVPAPGLDERSGVAQLYIL